MCESKKLSFPDVHPVFARDLCVSSANDFRLCRGTTHCHISMETWLAREGEGGHCLGTPSFSLGSLHRAFILSWKLLATPSKSANAPLCQNISTCPSPNPAPKCIETSCIILGLVPPLPRPVINNTSRQRFCLVGCQLLLHALTLILPQCPSPPHLSYRDG